MPTVEYLNYEVLDDHGWSMDDDDLFDPETTGRVILLQNVVPAIATVGAFLVFRLSPLA